MILSDFFSSKYTEKVNGSYTGVGDKYHVRVETKIHFRDLDRREIKGVENFFRNMQIRIMLFPKGYGNNKHAHKLESVSRVVN